MSHPTFDYLRLKKSWLIVGRWDNIIVTMDVLQPNKTDALAYLDQGALPPPRYARATLQFNSQQPVRMYDMNKAAPDLKTFVGELQIPKFPWNPSGNLQTNPGG